MGSLEAYETWVSEMLNYFVGHGSPVPRRVSQQVLTLYPGSQDVTANIDVADALFSDLGYICPSEQVVQLLSSFSDKKFYRYHFNYSGDRYVAHGAEEWFFLTPV